MKKLFPFLLFCFSLNTFAQQYWEDGFWKKDVKNRYEKTGSMMGDYTAFYNNGQIRWQGHCDNQGNPDSIWVYYTRDGEKIWQGRYNGMTCIYSEDEYYVDTLAFGNYQNGLKEGFWTLKEHSSKTTGYYHQGKPVGSWKTYKELTKVVSLYVQSAYDYNTQTETLYDDKGNILQTIQKDSAEFRDNLNDHFYLSYDEAGNLDFTVSAQYLNFNRLNSHFLQAGYKGLQSPVISGGMGYAVLQDNFYMSYNLNYMPGVSAQMNDSVKLNLMGYSMSANYGADLIGAKWIDLAPSFGIGFQQLRLKVSYTKPIAGPPEYSLGEGSFKIYKNPSPYIQGLLNLRLNLGQVSICATGGYVLDCSATKWRYNGRYLSNSPRTSVSGFLAMASIGIHFD